MYSTPPQGNYNIGSLCESLLDVLYIALVVFGTGGELVHFNRHDRHPSRAQEGGALALAVGVLHDPEHRTVLEPMEPAPRDGLTPAEARVAAATGDGKVAKVIARDLDVSLTTVRTHLKSICAKLDVRNANELIALLSGAVFHRPFEAGATRRRAMGECGVTAHAVAIRLT